MNCKNKKSSAVWRAFLWTTLTYAISPHPGKTHKCMHVCMVSAFSRVWINRVWLPILLVIRCSRLRIWSHVTGLAIPSRVSLLILHTRAESIFSAYSRDSSRFLPRRPFIPSTAIGPVPNRSGHAIVYRWRSLPRVRPHRASSPQGSPSNGCCLVRCPHGPINVCLSFPTPTVQAVTVGLLEHSSTRIVQQDNK